MARSLSREIWIVGAKRTAFGAFGGALKDLTATDLAVDAAKAALAQAGADPATVEHVVFGNVQQTSADAIYLARHVGLRAGVPIAAPALTVNRLCGSGFQAIINGAEQILLGEAEVVLVGGTETMSQAPHVLRGARWGLPFGKAPQLEDSLWDALTDSYTGMPMAITAENLAEKYEITRQECDEYALRSQKRWAAANEAGRFKDEIVAGRDQDARRGRCSSPSTSIRARRRRSRRSPSCRRSSRRTAWSPPATPRASATARRAGAVHARKRAARTAGSRWPRRAVGRRRLRPEDHGHRPGAGDPPRLERAGHKLADIDLVEVNEAFAPQYLAVEKELGLDRERTNVDGGAIALGHPLGASGARITTHLVYELRRRGSKLGIGSACIGGGQGIAVVVEAVVRHRSTERRMSERRRARQAARGADRGRHHLRLERGRAARHASSSSQISFFDETLRDGMQCPSVVDPKIEDKLKLVHLMDDVGIDHVDIGLPGAGKRAHRGRARAGARDPRRQADASSAPARRARTSTTSGRSSRSRRSSASRSR